MFQKVELLGNYLDLLLDMLCVVDDDGRFVYVSASVEQILGFKPAELIGRPMLDFVWPADLAQTIAKAKDVIAGQHLLHFENRYRHKAGHAVHLSWSARRSGTERVRVGVARDISALRKVQARQQMLYAIAEAAHQSDELPAVYQQVALLLASLLPVQHFQVALYGDAETDWQICYQQLQLAAAGAAVAAAVDHRRLCQQVALTGQAQYCQDFANESRPEEQGWLALPLPGATELQGVLLLHPGPEASYDPADLELLDYLGTQLGAAIERKTMLVRLQRLALYDSLTGLANRALLLDRLLLAVSRASREHKPLALLYLDLDKFKQINDLWGHHSGDWVLQQVASRLKSAVRQTDTVARFGGDEFVILLEQLDDISQARKVADKVLLLLHQSLLWSGQSLTPGASMGLAFYPADAADARQLMQQADDAMYRAKNQGGGCIVLAGAAKDTTAEKAAGRQAPA